MRGVFAALLRAPRAPANRAAVMLQQRAGYINSRPPKDHIGPTESMFVLAVMTLTVLGPSGWILANIDRYKSRG